MNKAAVVVIAAALAAPAAAEAAVAARDVTEGTLLVAGLEPAPGEEVFPLARTEVSASIAAFVAQVTVRQTFNNPFEEPLEAIYVFPLPQNAAIGAMKIRVGDRVIEAAIKTREEARAAYEQARQDGKTAALLDQERPNIFTQTVANIPAGAEVLVEITYDVTLRYEDGAFEFVYPMVVGPRYIPGTPDGTAEGGGRAGDTDRVPDASRITPPVRKPGSRSGHDISVDVTLDGGAPIADLTSPTHTVKVDKAVSEGRPVTRVALEKAERIPNKDLVLRYRLATTEPALAVAARREKDGRYLAVLVEPPRSPAAADITARELTFVVDTSGALSGEGMALVKQAMRHALKNLGPDDTFQIIRFADSAATLDDGPLANTPANVRRGLSYINGLDADGGTEMLAGVRAALSGGGSGDRLRVVCFMTDGFIGNETEILAEVERLIGADTRLFPVGVGSSVNRYLLERLAAVGRGAASYMLLDEPATEQIEAFYDRIDAPLVTGLSVDWGGLTVHDVAPARIPDLFAGQPLMLLARYEGTGEAQVTVRGTRAGTPVAFTVPVALPAEAGGNPALARLWARARIGELMARQYGGDEPQLIAEITRLALRHSLVSRYTSFVAVDRKVDGSGVIRTYHVPVEMPEGVSYEAVFESDLDDDGASDARRGEALEVTPDGATVTPGRSYQQGVTLASESLYVAEVGRGRGPWRFGLGVGLGIGSIVADPADDAALVTALRAGVDRTLPLDLAVGIRAALLLPGLDTDGGMVNLLVRLAYLRLLDGALMIDAGAGASLGLDAPDGLGYGGGVTVDLPTGAWFGAGLELRWEGAVRGDGADDAGAFTLGVELTW